MIHDKRTEVRIIPAANGWSVYTHDFTHPGIVCPTYVFVCPVALGKAVTHLMVHGTINDTSVTPHEFDASQLSH